LDLNGGELSAIWSIQNAGADEGMLYFIVGICCLAIGALVGYRVGYDEAIDEICGEDD
jgi:hypothetical protein